MTVIRISVELSEERRKALQAIAEMPGITVSEAIRLAIATEQLPGGPIAADPLLVKSGVDRADWHDFARWAGGGWAVTACRLMIRPVEVSTAKEAAATCPLCVRSGREERG